MPRAPQRRRAGRHGFETWLDRHGVPHVRAADQPATLAGLGYLHARDRRTQLLFARTIAEGRACEKIADRDDLLATDRLMRRIGLTDGLDAEVDGLSGPHRELLDAYCEGVNAGLAAFGRSLVMRLTGYAAEPWTIRGVLAVGQLLAYGALAIDQQESERLVIDLIRAVPDERRMHALLPGRLDGVDLDLVRRVKLSGRLSDRIDHVLDQLPQWSASNACAVAGTRSATGAALLSGDPHLEINRLPPVWYECVLHREGGYAMGATLPGCPLFAVTRTPDLAWSVTYMKGDTIDHAVEDVRAGDDGTWLVRRDAGPIDERPAGGRPDADGPGRGPTGQAWVPVTVDEATIRRRRGPPVVERILRTDAGTFVTDPDAAGPGLHLVMDWTGRRPGAARAITVWLDLLTATTVDEARAIVRTCPQPSLVWVFADGRGSIGWQGGGRFPLRPAGISGLAPRPAWAAGGGVGPYRDVETLPGATDPPDGVIAAANEELPDLWGAIHGQHVQSRLLPSYRPRRLRQILLEPGPVDRARLERAQRDLFSLQADDLLAVFLPDLPPSWLRDALAAWDRRLTVDSREATAFAALRREVVVALLGGPAGLPPEWARYLAGRAGWSELLNEAVDRLLIASARGEDGPDAWFTPDRRRAAVAAVGTTLAGLTAGLAGVPAWGDVNAFTWTDRFLDGLRPLAWLGLAGRRERMPGSPATPLQGHVTRLGGHATAFAPSYRLVTDLGEDVAWTNLPGGRSESPLSPSYHAGRAGWRSGPSKPLSGRPDDA